MFCRSEILIHHQALEFQVTWKIMFSIFSLIKHWYRNFKWRQKSCFFHLFVLIIIIVIIYFLKGSQSVFYSAFFYKNKMILLYIKVKIALQWVHLDNLKDLLWKAKWLVSFFLRLKLHTLFSSKIFPDIKEFFHFQLSVWALFH